MSDRINLLDMENPWSGGGGTSGDGTVGNGAGRSPIPGSPSGANGLVGGGALALTRGSSQSSYEWLRSLRDPDPLGSIGSPSEASPTGGASGGSRAVNSSDGPGNPTAVAGAGDTPDRPNKRQRTSVSPAELEKTTRAGNSSSSLAVNDGGTAAAPAAGGLVSGATGVPPVAQGVIGEGVSSAERRGVAAAGGGAGQGEVWGGGALARTLSEGATQVVSELGELGHREGEALSKIDSLGYQLAHLLDTNEPILGLDDISMFGEAAGSLGFMGGVSSPSGVTGNGGGVGVDSVAGLPSAQEAFSVTPASPLTCRGTPGEAVSASPCGNAGVALATDDGGGVMVEDELGLDSSPVDVGGEVPALGGGAEGGGGVVSRLEGVVMGLGWGGGEGGGGVASGLEGAVTEVGREGGVASGLAGSSLRCFDSEGTEIVDSMQDIPAGGRIGGGALVRRRSNGVGGGGGVAS